MGVDRKTISFGRYLMRERLEKGVSLKDVSHATRIGIDTLSLIENEDHSRLPAEVFVKGFLRSYAKTVGADSDHAVRLYLENLRERNAADRFEEELVQTRGVFWVRLLGSLMLLLCVMGAAIYADLFFSKPELPANRGGQALESVMEEAPAADGGREADLDPVAGQALESVMEEAPAADGGGGADLDPVVGKEEIGSPDPVQPPPAETLPPVSDVAGNPPSEVVGDMPPDGAAETPEEIKAEEKLRLTIATVEVTWLKIIVDEQNPKEYFLKPTDRMELEAIQGYHLLIGNATGVRLFLNDRPINVAGKKGQVVTLRIP